MDYLVLRMRPEDLERLGDADLSVAGLQIWVHGRQFPDSTDYWDGNWLRATAFCRYPGAWVSTDGPIIHLGELVGFLEGVERLYETLEGGAGLDCMEPNLKVQLRVDGTGHMHLTIDITHDHLSQTHQFSDTIDQSYLPAMITGCRAILLKYPIRGRDSNEGGV